METVLEIVKTLAPLGVAYIALLRHRVDLDIIAAKQRGGPEFFRSRWYSFIKKKSIKAFKENHTKGTK